MFVTYLLQYVSICNAYKAVGCSMDHVKADRMKLTVNGLVLTDESSIAV